MVGRDSDPSFGMDRGSCRSLVAREMMSAVPRGSDLRLTKCAVLRYTSGAIRLRDLCSLDGGYRIPPLQLHCNQMEGGNDTHAIFQRPRVTLSPDAARRRGERFVQKFEI